jgi:hypothetical protein
VVALLALYACLDFANPLMPGAVHFVHGVVTVVDGARPAPVKPLIALSTSPREDIAPAGEQATDLRHAAGGIVPTRSWRSPPRRPTHRALEPPPVGEDH